MVRGKAGAGTQENYELNLIRDYSRYIHMISSARFDYASIKYLFLVSCTFGECNGEGGLGFNRAAYLKYENNEIIGQMSIGNVSEEKNKAYREWATLDRFKSRREIYEEIVNFRGDSRQHLDNVLDTSLNREIHKIKIKVNGDMGEDYFSGAVAGKEMLYIGRNDEKDEYCKKLGTEEAIIFPLKSIEDKVLGLVYIDNNITGQPIDIESKKIATLDVIANLTSNYIELLYLTQKVFMGIEDDLGNPNTAMGGFANRLEKLLSEIDMDNIPEKEREKIKTSQQHAVIILKEANRIEKILRENDYAKSLEKRSVEITPTEQALSSPPC